MLLFCKANMFEMENAPESIKINTIKTIDKIIKTNKTAIKNQLTHIFFSFMNWIFFYESDQTFSNLASGVGVGVVLGVTGVIIFMVGTGVLVDPNKTPVNHKIKIIIPVIKTTPMADNNPIILGSMYEFFFLFYLSKKICSTFF